METYKFTFCVDTIHTKTVLVALLEPLPPEIKHLLDTQPSFYVQGQLGSIPH